MKETNGTRAAEAVTLKELLSWKRGVADVPGTQSKRVGRGLLLVKRPSGKFFFLVRYRVNSDGLKGKAQWYTIGSFQDVTLEVAPERARTIHQKAASGVDPNAEKQKSATAGTVAECRWQRFEKKVFGSPKIEKLTKYRVLRLVGPLDRPNTFGKVSVAHVTPRHVIAALEAAETSIPQRMKTSYFLREALMRPVADGVLDSNPCDHAKFKLWAEHGLHHEQSHYKFLPYEEIGPLLRSLVADGSVAARFLLALAYIPIRRDELLLATWDEVNSDLSELTVPRERMKNKKFEHAMPITESCRRWFGERGTGRIWNVTPERVDDALERAGAKGKHSTHSFRSTLSTYAASQDRPELITEIFLSHKVGNAVSRSYNRYSYWKERRALAEWWSGELHKLPS